MDHLLERLDTLEQHVRTLERVNTSVLRRFRWWRRLAGTLAVLTVFSLPLSLGAGPADRKIEDRKGGHAQHHKPKDDDDTQGKGLAQRVRALERKLEHVTSVIGPEGFPELVITGANLRIVNGLDETQTTNSLGNLIIGYNESRGDGGDLRTGSHNLVIGRMLNFSRSAGFVAGEANTISGDFAVVSTGTRNMASGNFSSIGGGFENTAAGDLSSVSGGNGNKAIGVMSSISGGQFNAASGFASSVSGGSENQAIGDIPSASGGAFHSTAGTFSSVTGGIGNVAEGAFSSVSGGRGNRASGFASSVSGGGDRAVEGDSDWAAGGLFQNE